MISSEIHENLNQFEHLLNTLHTLLADERLALQEHNVEALEQLLAEKSAVCALLNNPLYGEALRQHIQACEPQERAEFEARHTSALSFARQVRDSNMVNGKILHRSQKSISELLNILSGKPLDGLYGTSGQTVAAREHAAHAIAKA